MKRRSFIKQSSALIATSTITPFDIGVNDIKGTRITILHTNDVHSHIDPFGPNEGRNANRGGIARRAVLVNQIRTQNKNTLLLDAGDIFQGTPYFNYYGGELEFKLMSMLKYDAVTIGNHDFDNGIEGLYKQLPHAKFDFLSANYDFTNTILDTHVKPFKIFIREGIKIGVFGHGIELYGLVDKKMFKETKYMDPIEIAIETTRVLKSEGCDLIICLSHLGYHYKKNPKKVSDLILAKSTSNIDLIIGGHTHTFLKKPTVVKNKVGKNTLVNQVGCYGLYLGQIDFYFDLEKNKKSDSKTTIIV